MKNTPLYYLIFIFLLFLVLNFMTPMVLDDCAYGINGRSMKAIADTQIDAYFHSNGRVLSHSIVQIFDGIIGKGLFNVFNAIIDCILIYLISLLSAIHSERKNICLSITLALVLIWFFFPDQYVTMFMVAGSSNYVWGAVLNLLSVYLITAKTDNNIHSKWGIAGISILSFISGAWMEMFSICVAPTLFIWMLVKKNRNINSIIPSICYFIGACLVVLAPGNFSRMGTVGLSGGIGSVNYLARSYSIIMTAISSPLGIIWLLTLLSVIISKALKISSFKQFAKENIYFIICIFFSLAFIIVSYAYWPRTFFAIYTFSILILMRVVSKFNFGKFTVICTAVLSICLISIDFVHEAKTMLYKNNAISEIIESQRKYPSDFQSLPQWPETRKSIKRNFVSMYDSDWRMYSIYTYYELKPFGVMPDEVMNACKDAISKSERQETSDYIIDCPFVENSERIISATINYDSKDKYVIHPKVALLMSAFRIKAPTLKVYDQKKIHNAFLRKALMPATASDEVEFKLNENADNFIYSSGGRKLAIISKHSLCGRLCPIKFITYTTE